MPLRCLFGPVTAAFAEQHLQNARQSGQCLAFNATGDLDVTIRASDSWDDIVQRLSTDWRPDFAAVDLAYTTVPHALWMAPLPLVGLAGDWNLLWHAYRHLLPHCDLVLTDTAGVEVMLRHGLTHARVANLYGCGCDFLDAPISAAERDIDVLFVGNLQPAVQHERLRWLGRLAQLGDRWRIAIHTGVFGADYRRLLGRARIVFNRSIRGECNRRVFEAVASGALLFQEAGNREVNALLRDRQEYVAYNAANLEALLTHYLEQEDDRQRIAAAAQARAGQFRFDAMWQELAEGTIARDWDGLVERYQRRASQPATISLAARVWQTLGSATAGDPTLTADLAAALVERPHSTRLHNALGALNGLGAAPGAASAAAASFRRALAGEPHSIVAGLNLAEALAALEQRDAAVAQARQTLALLAGLDRLSAADRDGAHFPPAFDHFRVAWERTAWANAGDPVAEDAAKRELLRWRLHFLLARLTDELPHYHEAALARPDLAVSRAMLGCALARAGRLVEALPHLRQADDDDPFDLPAAQALHQALGDTGNTVAQRRLTRQRWLLHQAAPQVVPLEPWFEHAQPTGDELASILILCCNEVEYTQRCIESVLRCTRPPFELIVVDNGSRDETPHYLAALRQRPGPVRVEIIRNDQNRGYPAGCNQALAHARGDYLVFLNNDAIVTPGWLEGLIGWSLHDWPQVGLVGATTNRAQPLQEIPVNYADVAGLDAFASQRRQDYAGQALPVERLSGFCLLARREVMQKLGGFDEEFGLGFFDDDDLCLRARQAGFQLLTALDVFVHHFGNRTFNSLGVDTRQLLRDNFARFQAKWGEEHTRNYVLPAAPPPPADIDPVADAVARALADAPELVTPAAARPRVSLCMIVKNEEANLGACLEGLRDLFDEIVVVDTGSTDRTPEIAREQGAQVFDFPWIDSFAAARNESLRHATGDWIFWLDADDRLDAANRQKLRAVLADLPDGAVVGYSLKCVCLPDPVHGAVTVVDHVRLFPRHPEVRWEYRVHEQILPALRRLGGDVRFADVAVQHTGYQDPALRGRKLERDLRLLHLEDADKPDDPFTLFNLGSVYQELGKLAEALPLLQRSLERSAPRDSIVRKLYALIAQCQRHTGDRTAALATIEVGRQHYPDDTELLFQESLLRRDLGDGPGAEACLIRLLTTQERAHFASIDSGLRNYKARHNLGVLYHEQGRLAEAEAQWRAALAVEPAFTAAWLSLAELLLSQQRWTDLEQAIHGVAPYAPDEANLLQARRHLAQGEYEPARQLLEQLIAIRPTAIAPRRLLSHALLQQGTDHGAAEQALRDLLALAPDDREVQHNLAALREHPGNTPSSSRTTMPPAE